MKTIEKILILSLLCLISVSFLGKGRAYRERDDGCSINIFLEFAKKTAEWLESKALSDLPDGYKWPASEETPLESIGMSSGAAGVGTFFLELYKVTRNHDYLKYAEGAGNYLIRHAYLEGEIDWLSGAAGAGNFLLELWETTYKHMYLYGAIEAGEWLLSKHHEDRGGYYWMHYPDMPKIYTGFAHGAAGIGFFFARLYDAAKDPRYLEVAEKTAVWVNSYRWELNRGFYSWPRLTTDSSANTTWCGGSVGIIIFYLKLYDSTGEITYLDIAKGGGDWLISEAQDGGNSTLKWNYGPGSASYPFAYCHGTPSVAHILLELYRRTGNILYLDYAKNGARWLQMEAETVATDFFRWPHIKGLPHDTGFLTGTAGVGNSFALYYSFHQDMSYLGYAKGAAYWLISVADYTSLDEVKWINYVDDYDKNYGEKEHETSWYAGAAGVGLFFLTLSQVLPPLHQDNHSPILSPIGSRTVQEGQKIELVLSGTDPDNDPLVFIFGNLPPGSFFSGKSFSWTPEKGQSGIYKIYCMVTDGWSWSEELIELKVTRTKKASMRK